MIAVTEIQVRCPTGPRRLFTKLRLSGASPVITEDNLIEFACTDCRKAMNEPHVTRVLHRYDFAGELIETEVERALDRSVIL